MNSSFILTAPALSVYAESVKSSILGAAPSLRRDAERGVFISGHVFSCAPGQACRIEPECLGYREVRGGFQGAVDNTRAFYCPKVKNPWRLTMPQQTDLVDMLNVCRSKLAFISDAFTQDEVDVFRFSEEGMNGFYFILSDIEGDLEFISNEMQQREEVH